MSGNRAIGAVGILNYGAELTRIDSTVSGNTAAASAGGVRNNGALTLFNSTVSENAAGSEGESEGGGGLEIQGPTRIIGSTISGNAATNGTGGGIFQCGATLTITNSTVSGNSDGLDGGRIFVLCGNPQTTLTNVTLARNTAGFTGSTISQLDPQEGTVTVANSLVEGRCRGVPFSGGGNLESPGDSCGFNQSTDQVNITADDLALGPLQENGGPTMTHAGEADGPQVRISGRTARPQTPGPARRTGFQIRFASSEPRHT
ncbi:MAG: hypothetical protein WCF10_07835 [Polyangiales bacterium]